MDLISYAQLAVTLVNGAHRDPQLFAVFAYADAGKEREAVDLLNALLIRYPVHPQLSGHDGQRWHLHLSEGGETAGAIMGLAALVAELGVDRLGLCSAASCEQVFIDTSSNRSRRYCSERCASRANVAAYRARRRSGQ